MIPLERKNKIIDLLNRKKYMTVNEISEKIYASHMTVRRDLRQLEKEGFVRITRGSVHIVEHTHTSNTNYSYALRKTLNSDIKRKIAQKAFSTIQPGDMIFIDSSSTASYMAEFLSPEMNVTVVTNSNQTANLLAQKGVKFYLIGGFYNHLSMSFQGSYARECADRFHIDKMFFSSQGIVSGDYIYGSDESETRIRKIFITRSKKRYFLCTTEKMGKKFLFRVCKTSEIDEIITENGFMKEILQ